MRSKLTLLILVSLLIIVTTESCTKYDDGPWISLRSVKERVTGTWDVESLTADGIDSTQAVVSQQCYGKINIWEWGEWRLENYKGCLTNGTWNFDKNCKHLFLVQSPHSGEPNYRSVGSFLSSLSEGWHIKKLTNKQLWIETDYENIHWQVHLNKD